MAALYQLEIMLKKILFGGHRQVQVRQKHVVKTLVKTRQRGWLPAGAVSGGVGPLDILALSGGGGLVARLPAESLYANEWCQETVRTRPTIHLSTHSRGHKTHHPPAHTL